MAKELIVVERKGSSAIPLVAGDKRDEELAKRLAKQEGATIKRVLVTEPVDFPVDKQLGDALK